MSVTLTFFSAEISSINAEPHALATNHGSKVVSPPARAGWVDIQMT